MDFILCTRQDIDAFLWQDATNKTKYVANDYDCDDFAFRLMGQMSTPPWSALAFGILWTEAHAMNFFIDEDYEVWIVEPQSDAIKSDLEPWQGTKPRVVMI